MEQGRTYIFSDTIQTDSSGYAAFNSSSGMNLTGFYITATVTDIAEDATSEFSNVAGQGVVGISSPEYQNISVFPNPSDGLFFIELENRDLVFPVEVYNSTGKNIMNVTGSQIDLSSYPQGIYFIRFFDKNKILYSQKLLRL